MIGVMVTPDGEPAPLRHFFAVGHEDRAKAEWTAIDHALKIGPVAESPVQGLEPVHVVTELTPAKVKAMALRPGQVRAFGWKWPRRWVS
jgi:DhnA family fructose-bisphosphate aldolase class Ia